MNCLGDTALHRAAEGGHKATVELLINKGAHIHQKNGIGKNLFNRQDKTRQKYLFPDKWYMLNERIYRENKEYVHISIYLSIVLSIYLPTYICIYQFIQYILYEYYHLIVKYWKYNLWID